MKREEMKASLMRYRDAIVRERQMAGELRQLRIRRRMLEQCQGAEAADAAQSIGKLEQEIARNVEESLRTRGEVLALIGQIVPFPVSWTVKMKKKQKETQDILSYHTQAAGCSDKARAKASGGRQPIEECGRTGL